MTLSIGGLKTYQHNQDIASASWTIIHNLSSTSVVEFWVMEFGSLVKAFPNSVVHINENTISAVWTQPRIGMAYLIEGDNL